MLFVFLGVPGIITVVWVVCNSQMNEDKCWKNSFELSIAWIVLAPIVTALTVSICFAAFNYRKRILIVRVSLQD